MLCAVGTRAAEAQTPPAKATATVELLPGLPSVVVRITNLSNVPLEAWQIRLSYDVPSGTRQSFEVTTDTYLEAMNPPPGRGPIQPGQSREKRLGVGAVPTNAFAEVMMLSFADLSSEGSAEEVAAVLGRRERHAMTLDYWLSALRRASRNPSQGARALLKEAMNADEKTTDRTDATAQSVRARITELLEGSNDTQGLNSKLISLTQKFERQREQALRHKKKR